MVSVTAKPFTGPGAEEEQDAAETMVVTCVSMIVIQACAKPSWTAAAAVLPSRSSSRMRSKISTLESTPIPMVRMTPAMPGSVSVAPVEAHEAQQDHQVQDQRQVRVDARAAVVDQHEDHDRQHAGDRRDHALVNALPRPASARPCASPGT